MARKQIEAAWKQYVCSLVLQLMVVYHVRILEPTSLLGLLLKSRSKSIILLTGIIQFFVTVCHMRLVYGNHH